MFNLVMPWTKRRLAREAAEAKEKEAADAAWKKHKALRDAERKLAFPHLSAHEDAIKKASSQKVVPASISGLTARSSVDHQVRPRPGYVNDYSRNSDSDDMAMFLGSYQNMASDTPTYTAPSPSESSSSSHSCSSSSSDSGSSSSSDSGSSSCGSSDSGSSGGGFD